MGTVTEEAGEYTMKQQSLVKTSEFKFRIGEEFEELTADGRKVLSKMTLTAPQRDGARDEGDRGGQGQHLHQGVSSGEVNRCLLCGRYCDHSSLPPRALNLSKVVITVIQ